MINASGSPATVLVVDDDASAVDAFAWMLRSLGYGVRTATTVEAASAALQASDVSAMLLDLHLPPADGLEFLRLLRRTAGGERLPVAVVTGNYLVDEDVARQVAALGAEIFFKPLWEDDLLRITAGLLNPTGAIKLPDSADSSVG